MRAWRIATAGSLASLLLLTACAPESIRQSPDPEGTAAASGSPTYSVDSHDPRFIECGGDEMFEDVIAAFPFVASAYQHHFPEMGRTPELDTDASAFAVVFDEDWPGVPRVPPAEPGTNNVCIFVGTPPGGEIHVYGNIDLTGMRAEPPASPTAANACRIETPGTVSPPAWWPQRIEDGVLWVQWEHRNSDAIRERVAECLGLSEIAAIPHIAIYKYRIDGNSSVLEVVAALQEHRGVWYAVPNPADRWPHSGDSPANFVADELSLKFSGGIPGPAWLERFESRHGLRELSRAEAIGWFRFAIVDRTSVLDKVHTLLGLRAVADALPILYGELIVAPGRQTGWAEPR
jgi:hypothetical protein